MNLDQLLLHIDIRGVDRIAFANTPIRGRSNIGRYLVLSSNQVDYLLYNQLIAMSGDRSSDSKVFYETMIFAGKLKEDGSVDILKFDGAYEFLIHSEDELSVVALSAPVRVVESAVAKHVCNGHVVESILSMQLGSDSDEVIIELLEEHPALMKIVKTDN